MDDVPSRRDDLLGLILVLVIVLGTVALAHVLPSATSGMPSTPASFDSEPTCAEWGDGCVICQRTNQGAACSTPGIACVPRERQCLRREGV
jgi:hypothetical protein